MIYQGTDPIFNVGSLSSLLLALVLIIGWNDIAWIIPMNDTIELEVNWEWLYGKLPVGKYRIGKSITDFRESGDYDTATYFVEFEIEK